ncbi:hypothetical protein [Niallia taxi]|nr:hypothetical protein [Niallia taxi]
MNDCSISEAAAKFHITKSTQRYVIRKKGFNLLIEYHQMLADGYFL